MNPKHSKDVDNEAMRRKRANCEGSVRKKGRRWYLRLSGPSGRVEIATNARTRSEAIAALNDRLTEMRHGVYDPAAERTRVVDLYEDLKREYQLSGKQPAAAALEWRWKHLEPVFGSDRATGVTTARLRAYAFERRAAGASGGTINRELGALRRMFRLGAKADPARVFRVPSFPALAESDPRMVFFEREEFEKVREHVPAHLRPLVTLAYWLGWRRSELIRLEWRRVKLKRGTVSLDPGTTKNKAGRYAFLPPDALAVLKAWREETSRIERERGIIVRHVFHKDGEPLRDFYDSWRAACIAAGFPGRHLHDFRRTAARLYIRTGTPERVAMEILGHKTRSIFDRYNVSSEEDRRQAAARAGASPVGERLGENGEKTGGDAG
jgi:integrase